MKITFEGENLKDVFYEMAKLIDDAGYWQEIVDTAKLWKTGLPPGSVKSEPFDADTIKAINELVNPRPVVKPVDIPVQKPGTAPLKTKRERTEKQLANDEKMRVAALERIAAKKRLKADMGAGIVQPVRPTPPPALPVEKPVEEPFADPAEAVQLRQRTMEELQAAYANGHHKEVLELLSRFGDGAKSFRELPPEAFLPIRQAIDLGALESEAPK